MKIDFDPTKSERNTKLRSLSFDRAVDFDWETAVYYEDERTDYPEIRIIALGFLGVRLHVICFTPIDDGVRIISFRKANRREVRDYDEETADR
ncbi:MAG: BrnT family toxin [Desulfobacteraceae bacterium]|nr:MAG: BrnT family toxin [Desulfobacteraceae bacterium]